MTHGTRRSYQQGCLCLLCRAAEASYRATLRRQHATGRLPFGTLVPATDTAKRIRQLLIERMTKADLTRQLGLQDRAFRVHTEPGQWIRLRTVLRIARIYRLAMAENIDPNRTHL